MHDFILKEIKNSQLEDELQSIGFDKSYIHEAWKKFKYRNIKIFNLTIPQANILKQTALSVGADCATHRETITGKVESSDCIIGGSLSQLEKIATKLTHQPFGLKKLGEQLKLTYNKKENSTKIVGILNLTNDSFSDGGAFIDYNLATQHIDKMINEGADIIDIGAESTRPNAKPVSSEDQLKLILPILDYVANKPIQISIDTRCSTVAEECLKRGASIINDVSGFNYDSQMPEIIAKYNAKIIIQHSKGTPETMQLNTEYDNLMDEIYLELKSKIDIALSKGITKENIIIDPGIGFGKTREQNFEIIRRIEELYGLACPVMLGISRKSVLNMPDADNFTKDIYTVALNTLIIEKKVDYIRVHNVALHKQLLDLLK